MWNAAGQRLACGETPHDLRTEQECLPLPMVERNGIRLNVEIAGSGPPLLLIPGLGLAASECRPLTRALAGHCQVICIDNRGAGLSDKPDEPYTVGMMAEDASGVLRALGIPAAHVLGMSMGGKIAIALALQQPSQVLSLVLASTQAKPPSAAQGRRVGFLIGLTRLFETSEAYQGRERQRKASHAFDAWDRLGEIRSPTLVLHGRSDRVASFALAREMHGRIVGSKFLGFPGGHMFLFVRPAQFTAAVVDFIASLDQPTP